METFLAILKVIIIIALFIYMGIYTFVIDDLNDKVYYLPQYLLFTLIILCISITVGVIITETFLKGWAGVITMIVFVYFQTKLIDYIKAKDKKYFNDKINGTNR